MMRQLSDVYNPNSFAAAFRRHSFDLFRHLLSGLPRPVTILDVGGTPYYWDMMAITAADELDITLANIVPQPTPHPWLSSVVVDAANLSRVANRPFDVVYCYSLIEHVGGPLRQQQVAQALREAGERYFVQTPNFWFPIEPHFLFPGFQWLPLAARAWLVSHFRLGWIGRIPDQQQARQCVESIRLLRRKELQALFPDGTLHMVRLFGLTQSLIVYGGW